MFEWCAAWRSRTGNGCESLAMYLKWDPPQNLIWEAISPFSAIIGRTAGPLLLYCLSHWQLGLDNVFVMSMLVVEPPKYIQCLSFSISIFIFSMTFWFFSFSQNEHIPVSIIKSVLVRINGISFFLSFFSFANLKTGRRRWRRLISLLTWGLPSSWEQLRSLLVNPSSLLILCGSESFQTPSPLSCLSFLYCSY